MNAASSSAPSAEDRHARPEDDDDAGETDHHRRPAEHPHGLAQDERRQRHGDERRGIADRHHLRQRQEGERGEVPAPCRRGPTMPRVTCAQGRDGAQRSRTAAPAIRACRRSGSARRTNGRTRSRPAGCGPPPAFTQTSISVKTKVEAILRAIPRPEFIAPALTRVKFPAQPRSTNYRDPEATGPA